MHQNSCNEAVIKKRGRVDVKCRHPQVAAEAAPPPSEGVQHTYHGG